MVANVREHQHIQGKPLIPALNLKTVFETCHNYVYANEGLRKEQIFNEILKLIFLKIVDENANTSLFTITQVELELIREGKETDFPSRIERLLDNSKLKYSDVLPKNERIFLKNSTLSFLVEQLQQYSLTNTPADVKGTAFQTFVYAHARGERGEFFTPFQVMQLAVSIINPTVEEKMLDPACGSGAFLIESIKHCWQNIDADKELSTEKKQELKRNYTKNCLYGIEFNPDVARISKMYMTLYGNGHESIVSANSLYPFNVLTSTLHTENGEKLYPNSFDIILTNPPFGTRGKVTDKKILSQFELAHKWVNRGSVQVKESELLNGQSPEILFTERCLQFLKNYGRMAIVLPDGLLTNQSAEYFRAFVLNNARLLAVISLPVETFIPFGNATKVSVIFLQKIPNKELEVIKKKDYPIFMAECQKIGYDGQGNVTLKKDNKGRLVDYRGVVVSKPEQAAIDSDIDSIEDAFNQFKRKHDLRF